MSEEIEVVLPPPIEIEIDRQLTPDDIPPLDAAKIQFGVLDDQRIPATIARDAEVSSSISAAIAAHLAAADPHPVYTTFAETDAAIIQALAQHLAANDPHSQYTTQNEIQTAITLELNAHLGEGDPHPQYQTAAEVSSAISTAMADHAQLLTDGQFAGTVTLTGTTTETVLHSFEIPALEVNRAGSYFEAALIALLSASTNAKTLRIRIGSSSGTEILTLSTSAVTATSFSPVRRVYWLDSSNGYTLPAGNTAPSQGAGTVSLLTIPINWAQDLPLFITGQLASPADFIALKVSSIQVCR